MTNFSKQLMEKIAKEGIQPTSSWYFWLSNGIFWAIFLVSLILGGHAFGMILYGALDPDVLHGLGQGGNPIGSGVKLIPFFWILFFALFLLLAWVGLHHTKRGYKLSLQVLVTANLLGTVLIGAGAYALQIPETVEPHLGKLPFYQTVEERRQQFWSQPAEGLLGGRVVEQGNNRIFFLHDFQQKEWQVTIKGPMPVPPIGAHIRIFGVQTSENEFEASRLSPMKRPPKPQNSGPRNNRAGGARDAS